MGEEEEVWVRVRDLIFVLCCGISLIGERRSERGKREQGARSVV